MKRTMRAALVLSLVGGPVTACASGGVAPRHGQVTTASSAAAAVAVSPAGQAPSASPTPGVPAVTLAEAARVTRAILQTDNVVRASGDEPYALAQTRDAQAQIAVTAFRSTGLKPARYTWEKPTLLVPRLDRFPYWFAAVVKRHDGTGGTRTAVLAFSRQQEASRWQLAFASLLNPGTKPPQVILDAEGYATPLATRDGTVAISPHLMAPLHATIAEEGPSGFAAGLIAAGPQTTGYFTEVGKIQPEAKRRGFLYDSIFAATSFPIYALRMADGGAVILYSLTRTTIWQVKTDNALGLVPVPKNVRWAVGRPVVARRLRVVETQQYISHVSRRGAAEPAKIIGFDGAVTGVSAD